MEHEAELSPLYNFIDLLGKKGMCLDIALFGSKADLFFFDSVDRKRNDTDIYVRPNADKINQIIEIARSNGYEVKEKRGVGVINSDGDLERADQVMGYDIIKEGDMIIDLLLTSPVPPFIEPDFDKEIMSSQGVKLYLPSLENRTLNLIKTQREKERTKLTIRSLKKIDLTSLIPQIEEYGLTRELRYALGCNELNNNLDGTTAGAEYSKRFIEAWWSGKSVPLPTDDLNLPLNTLLEV
ncbi:hypothetical protein HN924_01615 [Candidatus Woesearchaeota archaeon]|jgi:hypothetical protein|nr:hypothetical protein [Candidatus Woesearchaeota archaeon]MBT7062646.1 hypothetical protein [Candidatus Woesearchaeota archaeon]MBT7403121.1 hypothetical protein [Candidatus Woesearchaeota archaeon]